MIEAIVDWLNSEGLRAPGQTTPLTGGMVTALYRNSAKVALTLFDRKGAARVVAKVGRRETADHSLEAEFESLRRIATWPLDSLRQQIPEALAIDHVGGRLVLAQTYMPGRPMIAEYYRPGHTSKQDVVTHDLTVVGSWLDRFQRESRTGEVELDEAAIDAWVGPVVQRYRHEIGWTDGEERLFDTVVDQARALHGVKIPLTAVHGDFSVLNLLVDQGRIAAVVDWELAAPSGLPFRDIYKFPTSYCSYLNRAVSEPDDEVPGHPGWQQARARWSAFGDWPNLAGVGYGYYGTGWFPDLVRRFVAERFASLELDPRLHGVFFPLFLAEQAMTLEDPVFRDGYRSVLAALAFERDATQHPELLEVGR